MEGNSRREKRGKNKIKKHNNMGGERERGWGSWRVGREMREKEKEVKIKIKIKKNKT